MQQDEAFPRRRRPIASRRLQYTVRSTDECHTCVRWIRQGLWSVRARPKRQTSPSSGGPQLRMLCPAEFVISLSARTIRKTGPCRRVRPVAARQRRRRLSQLACGLRGIAGRWFSAVATRPHHRAHHTLPARQAFGGWAGRLVRPRKHTQALTPHKAAHHPRAHRSVHMSTPLPFVLFHPVRARKGSLAAMPRSAM